MYFIRNKVILQLMWVVVINCVVIYFNFSESNNKKEYS